MIILHTTGSQVASYEPFTYPADMYYFWACLAAFKTPCLLTFAKIPCQFAYKLLKFIYVIAKRKSYKYSTHIHYLCLITTTHFTWPKSMRFQFVISLPYNSLFIDLLCKKKEKNTAVIFQSCKYDINTSKWITTLEVT